MYKQNQMLTSTITNNEAYQGESLEDKVKRILSNKETIKDGAPIIYTERKDGVNPSYNIRTDRFELAVEAMEGIHKASIAKREERGKMTPIEGGKKDDGGAEPIQGTGSDK